MITFFNDSHHTHAPEFEFYPGERVPCFESPARAEFVKTSLVTRGQGLQPAQVDNRPSGHHAGADFMDGYCFPNNAAVTAQAVRNSAAARVAVLDVDTFADDPISQFGPRASDFTRLGQRLGQLGLPTVFVLEGGYAAAELGHNAVNVIEGFEGV